MKRWVAYTQTENDVTELLRCKGTALQALEKARAAAPRGFGIAVGVLREGEPLPTSARERREKQDAKTRSRRAHSALVISAMRGG